MLKFFFAMVGLTLMSLLGEYMVSFFYFFVLSFLWLTIYPDYYHFGSFLGVDSLSWFLVLLTFWITSLMMIASQGYKIAGFFYKKFFFVLMLMMFFLFLTFSSLDMLSFYIFFEGSLIPIYLLIVGWGYQPERLQAGIYLLLYTVFASLPLLISIFFNGGLLLSYSFFFLYCKSKSVFWASFWFSFTMFAFLVKLPAFYVHLWLPKAHVEAPVSGSMMLAGVLLKLGCYGMMRWMTIFDGKVIYLSTFLVSLGLLGGLVVSFMCLRQVDLKSLIAYSSVSHMGLALAGLGSWGLWGYSSCLYTCVAHGLCSSGLFFLSGVLYDRTSSRSLIINKGLLEIMPSMSFWWFMFCIGNMAAPIFLNLVGEVGLLGSLLSYNFYCIAFLLFFSFMGACYSLYLFSSVQHGKHFNGMNFVLEGSVREYTVLFLHMYPLIILILKADTMSY
uniref:NADH-ubiquinone oxidoreductase chain 4 n=1 Tax=Pollicipes polymerus TaxID=36137 RepID=Q6SL10_POLPY|nr:NADH dehydrogenase subunit 4 [Pollicipes polymerus]AAS00863.1 NADH dehydrogenase subunit 4 [Pollicipes polymerus]